MYYKIFSTEKCVCFLFLVILFILNCSGFRIDNFAMSDFSNKRNTFVQTSSPLSSYPSSSNLFSQRIFNTQRSEYPSYGASFIPLQENPPQHKIRHRHQLRMMKHSRNAADSSSSPVFHHLRTSPLFSTTSDVNNVTSLYLAQNHLPIRNFNANNIRKRSSIRFLKMTDSVAKRPYGRTRNTKRFWRARQKEDIRWRAHRAQCVFRAELVAQRSTSDNTLRFNVTKCYKPASKILKRFCEGTQITLDVDLGKQDNRRPNQQQKRYRHHQLHYLLFLNSSSPDCTSGLKSVEKPKLIKPVKFNDRAIKRVCSEHFRK